VQSFGTHATQLVACVADGAGSAKYSDAGSAIACQTVVECAVRHHQQHDTLENLTADIVRAWIGEARDRISQNALARECEIREFATTLLVAIALREQSFFFQIGDGAMIAGRGGVFGVVFWPQSGEYANSTNFLTMPDFDSRIEAAHVSGPLDELALFSDGLERLALVFDRQTPHLPFCQPLFQGVRSATNLDALSNDLRRFLQSSAVNNRSDDDRTLLLATYCAADHADHE
jgi:hypothetical protein